MTELLPNQVSDYLTIPVLLIVINSVKEFRAL